MTATTRTRGAKAPATTKPAPQGVACENTSATTPTPAEPALRHAIPEALKQARLTADRQTDVLHTVLRHVDTAFKVRMDPTRFALVEDVYIEAMGGKDAIRKLEEIPEGWLVMADSISVASDHSRAPVRLHFGPTHDSRVTRPLAYRACHGYTAVDPALSARVAAYRATDQQFQREYDELRAALRASFKDHRNLYTLLRVPSINDRITPKLVSHFVDQIRKDMLPAVTEHTLKSAFAKVDSLPPGRADAGAKPGENQA